MKKVIEGYFYLCSEPECRGVIITPHKLSVDDIEELYRRELCVSTKGIQDYLKKQEAALSQGNILCDFIVPCEHFDELLDLLDEFRGRKVRIVVETLE